METSNIIILLAYLISNSCCVGNFDFIIVGGGTGGLAVARRLAEGGKHSVLVLESGGLPKPGMDVPAYASGSAQDPEVTFQYRSTPQQNSGLRNNGVSVLSSGKMVSGSSGLHFGFFNRGNPRDFDIWGTLTQDHSWNYSNILKYYKRSETYAGDFSSDQHGFSGPITVSRPRYAPGLKQWLAAGKSLGYPVADPNGPQQPSFSPVEFSKRFGRRVSSFTGYVQPIMASTPNLQIKLNTHVTQIIFEKKRAVGVRFQCMGSGCKEDNIFYANKEIVVSAGAIGSPLLLMKSGIGPKEMLRRSNIPIVQDLPVGQNLLDHIEVPLTVVINYRSESILMDEERDLTPETWKYFNKVGDGPYSSTSGGHGQAFILSSVALSKGESDWPDLHLLMSHSTRPFFAANAPDRNTSLSVAPREVLITAIVVLLRPTSKGTICLNPSDPLNGSPILDVGYLSDESEVDAILDGIKEMIRVFEETPAYKKLGARVLDSDIQMCRQFPSRTDDYWSCYIRYKVVSSLHMAGTCRMGRGPEDPLAVVDTKLRVIGVKGLRVVDASIMPKQIAANPQSTVYCIAEKASDMILEKWQNDSMS